MKAPSKRWPKEPNIYRYEHNGSHEWVVQFKRARVPYVTYFPDGQEGPDVSRARAIKYRDWLKPRLPPWHKLHSRHSTNTSGKIGVCRVIDRTRAGNLIPRWLGSWHTADGQRAKRSFSVLKYGARRAKQLAIGSRRAGIDKLKAARARG